MNFRNIGPTDKGGVDEFDNRGNAPIHLACMLNRIACLKVLLQDGQPDCRLQYLFSYLFCLTFF
mgnify:CR=1 FL=1